jgi:hypothetical protein
MISAEYSWTISLSAIVRGAVRQVAISFDVIPEFDASAATLVLPSPDAESCGLQAAKMPVPTAPAPAKTTPFKKSRLFNSFILINPLSFSDA